MSELAYYENGELVFKLYHGSCINCTSQRDYGIRRCEMCCEKNPVSRRGRYNKNGLDSLMKKEIKFNFPSFIDNWIYFQKRNETPPREIVSKFGYSQWDDIYDD